MILPPSFLDELNRRLSIVQVVGRRVNWDTRKSNPRKGDMWACCPFHQENTPSFHVDDSKGFYHCFGCGASGNTLKFVQEIDNLNFMEAVKQLAQEAGIEVPVRDKDAQEKVKLYNDLYSVTEQAAVYFRSQLRTESGKRALTYLGNRSLKPEAIERWGIGYAPNSWRCLWDHLIGMGVDKDLICAAGLAKISTPSHAPYDVFRDRIIFPIRDTQDRIIAFGGRALDSNAVAKYINSPETELFSKGYNLYNYLAARHAVRDGQPLVVAEGYMDVIALSEAGFEATCAPLGTAITEHQLRLLWRLAAEPIVALDGDDAGARAALRTIHQALPILAAGKSLQFATLPEGKDPDDVIRSDGSTAMQLVLDGAIPMVQFLIQCETEGQKFDSPERKARLEKSLVAQTDQIRDPVIRSYYRKEIREFCWNFFRTKRFELGTSSTSMVTSTARNSALARASADIEYIPESAIFASLIEWPELVSEFESRIASMSCVGPAHTTLRNIILRVCNNSEINLRTEISEELGEDTLEKLFSSYHVRVLSTLGLSVNEDFARKTVSEELTKLEACRCLRTETLEAEDVIVNNADDDVALIRLRGAVDTKNRAMQILNEAEEEHVMGRNGVRIKRCEREELEDYMKRMLNTKG